MSRSNRPNFKACHHHHLYHHHCKWKKKWPLILQNQSPKEKRRAKKIIRQWLEHQSNNNNNKINFICSKLLKSWVTCYLPIQKKKTHTHTNMDTRTHAQLECNSQYVQIAPAKKAADLITIIKVSRELKLY